MEKSDWKEIREYIQLRIHFQKTFRKWEAERKWYKKERRRCKQQGLHDGRR